MRAPKGTRHQLPFPVQVTSRDQQIPACGLGDFRSYLKEHPAGHEAGSCVAGDEWEPAVRIRLVLGGLGIEDQRLNVLEVIGKTLLHVGGRLLRPQHLHLLSNLTQNGPTSFVRTGPSAPVDLAVDVVGRKTLQHDVLPH